MSLAFGACLYRERRRLGLVTGLAYLAGMLFYLPSPVYLGSLHISVITGGVYAFVVALASVAVCLFLPRLRFMIEAVAMSRLLVALCVVTVPETGPALLTNPPLMALVVVAGGACISRLIHGQIEREPRRRLAFGPTSRSPVVAHGSPFQRGFVEWIDGAAARSAAA